MEREIFLSSELATVFDDVYFATNILFKCKSLVVELFSSLVICNWCNRQEVTKGHDGSVDLKA